MRPFLLYAISGEETKVPICPWWTQWAFCNNKFIKNVWIQPQLEPIAVDKLGAKRLFHFVSSCHEDETLPNLSTLMLTHKAHHTLIWRRAANQSSAAAPLESVIPAEGWWSRRSLCGMAIHRIACAHVIARVLHLLSCADIKIISFQSAAGTFIILQK